MTAHAAELRTYELKTISLSSRSAGRLSNSKRCSRLLVNYRQSLSVSTMKSKLSCRKHILRSFSWDRRDRRLPLQMSPVTESMLSNGTQPVEIPRTSEAS